MENSVNNNNNGSLECYKGGRCGEQSSESYEGVTLDIKFLSAILWVGLPK